MSTFSKTVVRCEVDVDEIAKPFQLVKAGRTPRIWQGVGVEFQFLFRRADEILDISNIGLISITILAATRTGAPYAFKTLAGASLDGTVTETTWADGSKQHAAISFIDSEMNLPGSIAGTEYFLVISGYTSDAPTDSDNFGWTKLHVVSDGVPADEGPVQAGNAIPSGATYDEYGAYVLAVTANTFYRWTDGANDTDVVNGTETVTTSGANFISQTTSLTLHGTPDAAVTATVRKSPTLPADEIQALVQNLIGAVVGVLHGEQAITPGDELVTVDISAHGLGSSPARVIPCIIKPSGGDKLGCELVDGTVTAMQFQVELSSPAPASGFKVAYILIQ